MRAAPIAIMGIFAVDLAFYTPRLPAWGETVLGSAFRLGPGGKGSNQAVAAARLGARVHFISKIGRDPFGDIARQTYTREGVGTDFLIESPDQPTGAAAIIIDHARGENAIIVTPGAAADLQFHEIERAASAIGQSAVFMTQLELPIATVEFGLALARKLGVRTILNPAPALNLPASIFPLCDYITPNEVEAEALTGQSVATLDDAARAADALLARGAHNVVLTLGARGVLVRNAHTLRHIPACQAGPVIDTTGAGDAFNAGFALALAEGLDPVSAARFGCAVAGISVTRHGTAPSMPNRAEVDTLLSANPQE
jgi:ribokinase